MRDGGKALYEALQAVNAKLDEEGEQLLVDLVEKARAELRADERARLKAASGIAEATLARWVTFDAAEKEEA